MAKRKPYRFVIYLAARCSVALLMLLPRSMLLRMGRLYGRLAYRMVPRQREKVFENLRRVYGREKTDAQIHAMGARVLEHVAQTAVDLLFFPKLTSEKIDQFVMVGNAVEVYRSLLQEGKGLIAITAHIGNWELLAGIFGLKGFSGAVVGRRIYYEPYNRWVVDLRQSVGVRTIYRDNAARETLGLLRRNEIVGLLPDQDIDSLEGVFVPFFGKEAYTPLAPVRLALASGAPILVNFLIRESRDRYRVVLGEVIRPRVETTHDEAVKKYTALWMREFEKMIRKCPEQWVWMHDRWKTRPEHLIGKGKEVLMTS